MRDMSVAVKWNRRAIIADIEQMISSGLWPPGTKLPTREQLRAHYGVGKDTIDGVMDIMIATKQLDGGRGQRVRVAGAEENEATGTLPESTPDSPDETQGE